MPVIVAPSQYRAWLAPATPGPALESLLAPYPAAEMRVAAANPVLNSPKYDGPEYLDAA